MIPIIELTIVLSLIGPDIILINPILISNSLENSVIELPTPFIHFKSGNLLYLPLDNNLSIDNIELTILFILKSPKIASNDFTPEINFEYSLIEENAPFNQFLSGYLLYLPIDNSLSIDNILLTTEFIEILPSVKDKNDLLYSLNMLLNPPRENDIPLIHFSLGYLS